MEKKFENGETKIRDEFENSNSSEKTIKTKERKLFMMYIVLKILVFLASISTIVILIVVICKKQSINGIAGGCAMFFSLAFMFCTMPCFIIKASKNHKLGGRKMSQLLGFEQYYQLAINEATNGKIRLVDISDKFNAAPLKTLNKKNNDKVLNMIYDNKVAISFGTITISEYKNWFNWINGNVYFAIRRCDYHYKYSQSYLACELLHKNFNMNAMIKKNNIFNKSMDNTDLESTIFEKCIMLNQMIKLKFVNY